MIESNHVVFRVADLRAFLIGAWRISRTVRDVRLGLDGTFDGTATLESANGGDLLLRETGVMRFGGHAGPAEQTYRYAFPDGPRRALVFRHDGAPFHDLDLSTGTAEAVHHCGADTYRGRFRVEGWDTWVTEWLVGGPRKNYHMITRHSRLVPPTEGCSK
ncbi:hypothetical protein N825_34930 [Skermanella stibiiresistens SB22]|uniref:DUF6314 domain-containing protein n=1 Tax=Skermanella stibiiresistens SB22 TaxID=1385369 RepID=W9H9H3_9PROT|nr:hypothetical protein N825_34930 [Skermanella stibiiresistens SB22]